MIYNLNPNYSQIFYYKAKLPAIIGNARNLFSFPKQVRGQAKIELQLAHEFFIFFKRCS